MSTGGIGLEVPKASNITKTMPKAAAEAGSDAGHSGTALVTVKRQPYSRTTNTKLEAP